ncbi:MAG: ribosome-associated translation inhibitor RaiA [Gammaproteobacteria bacterium]|jgi:putative sigma-54 modulation protein|nr:MAG: ribosome-associated translation inhibitor RaiA [Gammaproteobacteria bacterium]
MELKITGHHLEITDALNQYVREKFKKLERHFEFITSVHVILSVEKINQKAEAIVHIKGGEVFADSVSEDMYAAIDLLIDKLDRQLMKHKGKITAH